MTAAVFRNTPSLSIPPTQNTAPVLDFNCLYTHDVKKKAKKWQDGFLRYHTFNKRVMVYDEGRNLVGDTHWAGDEAVQEGDELRLERNGVMVEVGDSTGQTETDLTELRKSRKKDSNTGSAGTGREAGISTARATPTPSGRPLAATLSRANTQLKHRSLNALLGTPKGPIGKASLPQKSPFEERQAEAENEEWESGRPPKRQRNGAPDWTLTRTTKISTPAKQAERPLWARTADAAKQKKKASLHSRQQQLGTKEVINLSDDDVQSSNKFLPGFSDEVLAQSSSPPRKPPTAQASDKIVVRSSSPAFQTQHDKPPERPRAAAKEKQKQRPPPEQVSASGATTVRMSSDVVSKAVRRGKSPSLDKEDHGSKGPQHPSATTSKPASTRTGQTLRLAASAPKKRTLLCQDQYSKKPRTISSTDTDVPPPPRVSNDESDQEPPTAALTKLQARLAKIEKKKGSTSSARLGPAKTKPAPIELDCDTDTGNGAPGDFSDDEEVRAESPGLQTSHETSAIELGRLDSMMLPPAAPTAGREVRPRAKSPAPPSPPAPVPARTTPQPQERQFRRVLSESDTARSSKSKRVPGAPVRYTPTPSPTKRSREPTPVPAAGEKQKQPAAESAAAPGFRASRQKKPLQKSVSLNMTSNGTSKVMLSKPFQAPGKPAKQKEKEPEAPKDLGPWSREAFDLFTWRPPNWDEEKWCVKSAEEVTAAENAVDKQTRPPPPGLSGGAALPYAG